MMEAAEALKTVATRGMDTAIDGENVFHSFIREEEEEEDDMPGRSEKAGDDFIILNDYNCNHRS